MVAGLLWQWAHTNQGTGQARLAYPALPAIGLFFVAGLAESAAPVSAGAGCRASPVLAAGGVWRAGVSVWVLLGFLLPLYHLPPRIRWTRCPSPPGAVPSRSVTRSASWAGRWRSARWRPGRRPT